MSSGTLKWMRCDLNGATIAELHQVTDLSWLNTRSNECFDVVVIHLLQLHVRWHVKHSQTQHWLQDISKLLSDYPLLFLYMY